MTSSPNLNATLPDALHIALTVEEGQLIVEALAELSFRSVFELIGKLNRRANELIASDADNAPQEFLLTAPELLLIFSALGDMPFNQVHTLVDKLKRQMQLQAELAANAAASAASNVAASDRHGGQ